MNSLFFTDLDNAPSCDKMKTGPEFFDYKELVESELQGFSIPFEIARVAVIDLKIDVYTGFVDKLTPKQSAVMMIDKVREIYRLR